MKNLLNDEMLTMFRQGALPDGPKDYIMSLMETVLDQLESESDEDLEKAYNDPAAVAVRAITEAAEHKLEEIIQVNPWMKPDAFEKEVNKIVGENASVKTRRRKVIAIANRVGTALEPHVACKPGCSDCCHMNTMIYEHEAIRLAEVTGRAMTRLPYRPRQIVFQQGDKFNGTPCPFLSDNKCSVYEDRPMVCRTHHSLNPDASACKTTEAAGLQLRPAMYNPDLLEVPYMELNAAHNPAEPWGNIAEFFPG